MQNCAELCRGCCRVVQNCAELSQGRQEAICCLITAGWVTTTACGDSVVATDWYTQLAPYSHHPRHTASFFHPPLTSQVLNNHLIGTTNAEYVKSDSRTNVLHSMKR